MKSEMNLFSSFENEVKKIVQAIEFNTKSELDLSKVSVEPPRDSSHGDLATNAAMVLARQVGLSPRELAASISSELERHEDIQGTRIAGPGFINIKLEPAFWARRVMTNSSTVDLLCFAPLDVMVVRHVPDHYALHQAKRKTLRDYSAVRRCVEKQHRRFLVVSCRCNICSILLCRSRIPSVFCFVFSQ